MTDIVFTEGEEIYRKSIGRYLSSDKVIGKMALWLMVLITFAYPIVASIATLVKIPTTPINVGVRGLYVIVSLIILFLSIFKRNTYRFRWFNSLILIFWLCYAIRLVYDIEIMHIKERDFQNITVYLFAFGNCMLPAFAMMVGSKYINLEQLEKVIVRVLFVSNILVIILLAVQAGLSLELFIIRQRILGVNKDNVINEITLSFTGCQLFVFALNLLLLNNKSASKFYRLFLVICLFIGLFNLFVGGSRSPMILMSLLTIYTIGFYFKKKHRFSRFLNNFKVFIVIVLLGGLGVFAASKLKNVDFALLERLTQTTTERKKGEKEERDFMQEVAMEQFYSSPIVGHQYLNTYNYIYPHNILIEVLMALGAVGAILFYPFIGSLIYRLITIPLLDKKLFRLSNIIWLSLLVSLFSGSLWNSTDFWVLSVFWMNFNNSQPQEMDV